MKSSPLSILAALIVMLMPRLAVASFTDVPAEHPNAAAIGYLENQQILKGYPDGSLKPEAQINRAEFVTVVMRALPDEEPTWQPSGCFADVASEWFAADVCEAKAKGIISGHPDGTFKASDPIKLVEAAKILVNTLKVPTQAPAGDQWYSPFLEAMGREHYLPDTFKFISQKVTRAQMAEMVWRILTENHSQPYVLTESLKTECQPLGEDLPGSIDSKRLQDTWIGWINEARGAEGKEAYVYHPQLHRTALAWSEKAEDRGYMDHKRDGTTAYYDYWAITDWFKNLGLTFKNVQGVTHTENIGWGPYNCSQIDCTDQLLKAMRYNFDYYMKEGPGGPHYNSIMNHHFKEVGMGVAVDEAAGKMYLTTHYGTQITSNPLPICEA